MDSSKPDSSKSPPKRYAKRTKFLLNPKFQLSFMGYMIGLTLACIAIFYGANLYFFWKFRSLGQSIGLPVNHVFFKFINEQLDTMNLIFAITSAIAFVVLSVGGLLLSHRVAGPLYRLCRHMSDIADGKTEANVKFRDKDFFMEVADAFNRMLVRFRGSTPAAPPAEKKDAA